MMRRAVPALVSVLLCVAALTGCGDDDGDESVDGSVRDGSVDSGDGGGTAGKRANAAGAGGRTAPRAGSGGKSGSGGTAGEHTGESGAGGRGAAGSGGAGDTAEPTSPVRDGEGCPKLTFPGLFTLPACCTSKHMCGVDTSMFGGPGCLDLATAAERARMSGATVIFPAPRACEPEATDTDAGTPDASDDAHDTNDTNDAGSD